jgi:hypothetical protein
MAGFGTISCESRLLNKRQIDKCEKQHFLVREIIKTVKKKKIVIVLKGQKKKRTFYYYYYNDCRQNKIYFELLST